MLQSYVAQRLEAGYDPAYLRQLFDFLTHVVASLEAPARSEATRQVDRRSNLSIETPNRHDSQPSPFGHNRWSTFDILTHVFSLLEAPVRSKAIRQALTVNISNTVPLMI